MKQRKKRKKDIDYKQNLKKSMIIFIMLICIIIAMIMYWIYAYHHKYDRFYFEDKIVSYKISSYVETKGDIIYLKNINENISENFIKNQKNIINNNNIVSIDITKGIYNDILSIMINYTFIDNYEEVLALNIDLKNDKLLSNDDILEIIGNSYKDIATEIFNNHIKLPDDVITTVKDAITEKELTTSEFNKESEKYIIRIREKLPEVIKIYIDEGKVYYVVRQSELDKICYYTNDNKLVNIKKEIGKI